MAVFKSSGGGVRFTAGDGTPITPDPVNPAHTDWSAGGISDGMLGLMGVQPDQYAQARQLYDANVASFNDADRLSGIDPRTAGLRQQASAAGTNYLNGNTLGTTGGGMGGIQSDPANAALQAQMAQRPPMGGATGNMPPGMMGRPAFQTPTGGTSGGMFQDVDVNSYSQNPYLAQMGSVLTNRVTDNLNRNILPGIRSNAVMAGGFGGSRQGVVEANAMKDANQTISDALTGAYFQDFTNSMNRNLQQYGQNQGFYSNQRGQDLAQIGLGASLFNQGNQGFLGQGQGIYGLGTTQQQAPWQVVNNGNAGFGQWSGFGTTTQAGGGAQGMLGGALAGGQLGSLWGGTNTGVTAPVGGYGANANYSLPSQGGLGLRWP